jgi:ATP-dependent Lhr-like helicase
VTAAAFDRLHPSVRYLVREVLRFPGLRPVQAMTIAPVLEGRDLVVLAPTAGGKTEAAFFPVLSRVLEARWPSVPVLYVSPLRALLNNQAPRIERMAKAVGLEVGKWHGDVSAADKKQLVASPPHVLLITPESLEVLLMTAPERAEALLSAVRIAVIDEVHALASDPRGAHLLSVLERLQLRSGHRVQRIGLSATVGNPADLSAWLAGAAPPVAPAVVSPPREAKPPQFLFRAARNDKESAGWIEKLGGGKKRLVFVEGRRQAEALAGALEARGTRAWVHHSSVGRAQRSEAEQAFELRRDAVLVATSSMELGIDIGDLDQVYQVDAPGTVSSLAQRVGRTGRRAGTRPEMTFLLTDAEALLVALATSRLFEEGWVEDVVPSTRPWPVLVHQMFANVLQQVGLTRGQLLERVRNVPAFAGFEEREVQGLIEHLVRDKWLDELDGGLMLGTEGEREFGRRNFFRLYAVFDAGDFFQVMHGREAVGTIERWFAFQLSPQRPTFRLAGRAWKMTELDPKRSVVRVAPAPSGTAPQWAGQVSPLSRRVCERILGWVTGQERDVDLDATSRGWLAQAREVYAEAPLGPGVRPVAEIGGRAQWLTFAGLRINAVLARLVEHVGGPSVTASNLALKARGGAASLREAALAVLEMLERGELPDVEAWADFDTTKRTAILSSFQQCLPASAEQAYLRAQLLDVEGAAAWSRETDLA